MNKTVKNKIYQNSKSVLKIGLGEEEVILSELRKTSMLNR